MAFGCGSAPKQNAPAEEKPPSVMVHTGMGSTDHLSPAPKRTKLWTVRWEHADLTMGSESQQSGKMETVTGEIYRDGHRISTFAGDTGHGSQTNQTLELDGHVKVIGADPKGTLTCDRLEYDGQAKILKAKGAVTYDGANGILGPLPELWATPDLKEISSPELFKKP